MTKPNDIPQDVWDKATEYFGDLIEKDGSIPFMTPHEIAARAIMKAKEEEREESVTRAIYAAIRNRKLANNTNKD